MPQSRNGTDEVISVGDHSFPFDLDTNVEASLVDSATIRIDEFVSGAWNQVMSEEATFLPSPDSTVVRAIVPNPSPFANKGRHRARAILQVTSGGPKAGDFYYFKVEEA